VPTCRIRGRGSTGTSDVLAEQMFRPCSHLSRAERGAPGRARFMARAVRRASFWVAAALPCGLALAAHAQMGLCRQFDVALVDGSIHGANLHFTQPHGA
jgi:hypothetical protein